MAFRGTEAGDVVEAQVATGTLRLELGPRSASLRLGDRHLILAERVLTLATAARRGRREKRESLTLPGMLWVARDVPHEDLGIWIAEDAGGSRVRRVFATEPRPLLDEGGLEALRGLDRLVARLRRGLAATLGPLPRAIELGRGADKLLLVEHAQRFEVFQRPLFTTGARRVLEIHRDGRVIVLDGKRRQLEVRSRYGITVIGDYLRFADPSGLDLGKVSIPWIGPEDRRELARRLGELVDRA